ncbi:Etoposide-induced protein 2.4-like protein [Aphelenchoides besseyi]|nr:Etoposide-induced protein 2.4-like protein [Aphelenchoides besseyi]
MFREFLIEYKNGVLCSIQGFLVFYKLDQKTNSGRRPTEPRASSVERSRQTVLERRRMKKEPNQPEITTPTTVRSKASALKRIGQCVGINLLVMVVLQLLIWITEWLIPNQNSSIYGFCNVFRNTLILPIFIVIRVLSTLWFADIASAAYKYRGTPPSKDTTIDIPRAASDFLHAIVLESVFLIQTMIIASVPVPGIFEAFGFVCMSILHSLYSFEYKWMSSGIEMTRRLDMVERRWAFHFGFGTLLTILTSYVSTNFVVNSCIFGAAFPFFIVSSFLADIPEPSNPEIPNINFFFISQFITAKISFSISHKFSDSTVSAIRPGSTTISYCYFIVPSLHIPRTEQDIIQQKSFPQNLVHFLHHNIWVFHRSFSSYHMYSNFTAAGLETPKLMFEIISEIR